MRINWKTWKLSFPYICTDCDHLHYYKAIYCESCGKKDVLRKVVKTDYKLRST